MQCPSVNAQVARYLFYRAAPRGQQHPDHLTHLLKQSSPGVFADTFQVLMNITGHIRIGAGQGFVEVDTTTDDAIHQAIELHGGGEHSAVSAVVERRRVTEANH
ncbi:hypothetical protein D9M71_625910 [compost metagenome]